jgi:hypothetical protein
MTFSEIKTIEFCVWHCRGNFVVVSFLYHRKNRRLCRHQQKKSTQFGRRSLFQVRSIFTGNSHRVLNTKSTLADFNLRQSAHSILASTHTNSNWRAVIEPFCKTRSECHQLNKNACHRRIFSVYLFFFARRLFPERPISLATKKSSLTSSENLTNHSAWLRTPKCF